MKDRIYLIGMPGSGKTTLGKILAKHLGYTFVDLDEKIVEKEKISISEIFAQKGENSFRQTENELLKETLYLQKAVISTGGGVPCFFDNMGFIKENGFSIWLNISPEILAKRIFESKATRPMFQSKTLPEMLEILTQKLQERQPFYQQADIEVSDEKISSEKILQLINKFD